MRAFLATRMASVVTARTVSRSKAAQAFAETTQCLERTLLRGMVEQLLTGQSGTEPDRFLEGLEWVDLIANNSPDLQAKAIGTQVNTGD
jgi:hypothetical protein